MVEWVLSGESEFYFLFCPDMTLHGWLGIKHQASIYLSTITRRCKIQSEITIFAPGSLLVLLVKFHNLLQELWGLVGSEGDVFDVVNAMVLIGVVVANVRLDTVRTQHRLRQKCGWQPGQRENNLFIYQRVNQHIKQCKPVNKSNMNTDTAITNRHMKQCKQINVKTLDTHTANRNTPSRMCLSLSGWSTQTSKCVIGSKFSNSIFVREGAFQMRSSMVTFIDSANFFLLFVFHICLSVCRFI